jgi:hypothetical protein
MRHVEEAITLITLFKSVFLIVRFTLSDNLQLTSILLRRLETLREGIYEKSYEDFLKGVFLIQGKKL